MVNAFATAQRCDLRDLMTRTGRSTTRAALIYQHRTAERDKLVADAMDTIMRAELDQAGKASGTQR